MMDKYSQKILIALLCLASILRLISLAWGSPFFFHPDERNIASAIAGLSYPDQFNPHFFAYGSLPIYLTFFTGLLKNFLTMHNHPSINQVSFEDAILILRGFSTFLSIGTIYLIFKIGQLLKDNRTGLIAAFFSTFSIGLIQYAHFGTFETWLTFFSTLLFYGFIKYFHKPTRQAIIIIAVSLGILISVKISSIIFLPTIGALYLKKRYPFHKKLFTTIVIFIATAACYLLTNPFVYLDHQSFLNSISYESNVALGKLIVFYTGEFLSAIPILFPIMRIYPFILGPIFAILFPISFVFILVSLRKRVDYPLIFLLIFLSITFFSQTFLFAQWTRYFIPTLPFIYLCVAYGLSEISNLKFFPKKGSHFIEGSIGVLCMLWAFAFIKTVYFDTDTRIQALTFANKTIPSTSPIISEVYDLGITPFNSAYPNITLFNFYDLDNNSPESTVEKYNALIDQSDYLILPSQRLYKTRLVDAKNFPKGNAVYNEITTSGRFEKIYETPCDFWCSLLYINSPIFSFEQTVNIFDRPTVILYKIRHEAKH